ncbi:unnamed protein product [Prunus armeniaca]
MGHIGEHTCIAYQGNLVSKGKLMIDEDQKFQGKVVSLSHSKTTISTIKEKLSPQQLQRFQDSCFGHLLLIKDLIDCADEEDVVKLGFL